MNDIEVLIKNSKKYKDAIIQKRFNSKKNIVIFLKLDDKPYVLKWFSSEFKKNIEIEYLILSKGSDTLNIPAPLEKNEKNNFIIMNYINGENLCDLINDEKTSFYEKQKMIIHLSNWFSDFHNYFREKNNIVIRGDSILRNFIFSNEIWGLDFENSRYGNPIEDVAEMCASILSTDPMFTDEKKNLCRIFIKNYENIQNKKFQNINNDIEKFLIKMTKRRPNDKNILDYSARKIIKTSL